MKKIQGFILRASNHAMFGMATFMLAIGTAAVTRCVVPLWHNEPEMPKSMLDEM